MPPIPLVSVIIAYYKQEGFITETVRSVQQQTYPGVEIIVVDDGSTDDTGERVKKYGSRIRYFYKANGGQAAALNSGFANARGEIVALLDKVVLFVADWAAEKRKAYRFCSTPYTNWLILTISAL